MNTINKLNLLTKIWAVNKPKGINVNEMLNQNYRCYLYQRNKLVGTCDNYVTAQRWLAWDTKKTIVTIINPDTPKWFSVNGYTACIKNYDTLLLVKRLYGAKVRRMA